MIRLYIHALFQIKTDTVYSHAQYYIAFVVYIPELFCCLHAGSLSNFVIIS